MKKLKKTNGESIAETLVAVLLMSLAFLMLVGAVVTAARINDRVRNSDVTFAAADTPVGERDISINVNGTAKTAGNVEIYNKTGPDILCPVRDERFSGYFTLNVTVTVAETPIFAARTTVAYSISSAPETLREKLFTPLSKL